MWKRSFLALAAAMLVLAGSPAVAASPAVVGDLIQELAALRGLPAETPTAAEAALRGAGFELPEVALEAPLTEGTVVAVAAAVGVDVRTSQPSATFDSDQLSLFVLTMTPELTGSAPETSSETGPYPRPNEQAADPLTKGKGLKKGLRRSPSGPL